MFNFPLENKNLRGGKIDQLAQKDTKTLCFAPSGLHSKRLYLFGANTFNERHRLYVHTPTTARQICVLKIL